MAAIAAVLPNDNAAAQTLVPVEYWQPATPESRGFISAKLADALLSMRKKDLAIHSLLIVSDGKSVLDARFHPYDGTSPHDLASVTKSITTALIAIAARQGKLDLDQPVLSLFPHRKIANRDARKERITIRHLAGMSSGLDCQAMPGEPTLRAMRASADWVQFVLDRKMTAEPGVKFEYCSPGMHLLSAALQQASGQTALDFAKEHLFGPLGIADAIWPSDPQGVSHGWGDLHLHPHDMAKIGYLWLKGGVWEGRQIVPAVWVVESSRLQIRTGYGRGGYGYGWWVTGDEIPQFAAIGRGGQRIAVFPTLDTVVAMTGGGYEPSEVLDLIASALVRTEAPPAPDPDGEKALAAALASIAGPPQPHPFRRMPHADAAVSGRNYVFSRNPLGLEAMRLDFDGSAEARLTLVFPGEPPRVGRVGLDGLYRFSPGDFGLPVGIRAEWTGPAIFVVDYNEVAGINRYRMEVRFDDDDVVIYAKERTDGSAVTLTGRATGS